MLWQQTPYILSLLIAAVMAAALAWFGWQRRPAPGAGSFTLFMIGICIWMLGYSLEWAAADIPTRIIAFQVEYFGIVLFPSAFLTFVLAWGLNPTGRDRYLTHRNIALLCIEPLITVLIVWTNDAHHLFWISAAEETVGSLSILNVTLGPALWMNLAYTYLLLLCSTIIVLRTTMRSARLYREQVTALLIAICAPWFASISYFTQINPFKPLDPTPFAFLVTGLAFGWALFSLGLLDLAPIARDVLIENMADGMIVLDNQRRIVDLNPSAQRIIGQTASDAIGQPVSHTVVGQPDQIIQDSREVESHGDIVLIQEKTERYFELRISPLYKRRRLIGQLLMLHDVTERQQAQSELEKRVAERTAALAEANETLRTEIGERQQAEAQLKASLTEKEVLFQEVHHRVKNNLQVISSLLYLQAHGIKEPAVRELFLESQNRIRSMALVHETLYRSKDLAQVDLGAYVRSLTNHVFQSYHVNARAVQLQVAVENINLSIDTAVPCGLLINELVSNALKHAFPDGRPGALAVELHATNENDLRLVVSDDGIGFPPDADFRQTSSLGLQLVNLLVSQLAGTVELEPSRGTRFVITFPVAGPRLPRAT